jgi:hypothetical protein
MIPLPIAALVDSRRAGWICAALVVIGLCLASYNRGAAGVRAEWQDEKDRQAIAVANVKTEQAEAVVQVVTRYVDRIKIVREKGETIIKEVPVYVPSDACDMPGGFRLLHDAAARGEPADPAGIHEAAPVAAQDVAGVVAENYKACRENAEHLTALQDAWQKVEEAAREKAR